MVDTLATIIHSFFAFAFIISVIVFIHEFGHYYVAKRSGVKIEVFSVGFGREIIGWTDKHGTRWKISMIPFGGYVKMFGDADATSAPDSDAIEQMKEEEKAVSFHYKPLWIKTLIVAAGPIANFVLAIAILTFFFSYYGKSTTLPEITQVLEDSAAKDAGLQAGDVVLSIDDEDVTSFSDIRRITSLNTGTPIDFVLERGTSVVEVTLTPRMREVEHMFGEKVQMPMVGIAGEAISFETLPVGQSFLASIKETYYLATATLKAVGQMLTGERSARQISGPIGIAKYSGKSVEMGLQTVLWFMVILSVNLGLVNLFPIPGLDGGHLLYYSIEAVRGKPMADHFQEWGLRVGLTLIIALAIFAVINDVLKELL